MEHVDVSILIKEDANVAKLHEALTELVLRVSKATAWRLLLESVVHEQMLQDIEMDEQNFKIQEQLEHMINERVARIKQEDEEEFEEEVEAIDSAIDDDTDSAVVSMTDGLMDSEQEEDVTIVEPKAQPAEDIFQLAMMPRFKKTAALEKKKPADNLPLSAPRNVKSGAVATTLAAQQEVETSASTLSRPTRKAPVKRGTGFTKK